MIRAALLLALTAIPASAQGWQLTPRPEEAQCTAALTSEAGAALAITGPAVAEASPDTPGFTLRLWLPALLRDLLPMPDGEVALAFRPAGQPAVQLDGTLEPDAAFYRFTHAFETAQDTARFILATRTGRLTLFHPEAGVLAGFDTAGAEEALAGLLACAPAPEAAE
ncbi:hypothetical protein [Vannielia litorea]|uniref:Uncharacterized protein n=1 Tax=Vannielia litorea TaxID=1217970 RepID=A0A1N6FAA5_9RHOB|nr:hypothetical protein [Vannielia litorea]SIN92218.1 hypothetical protein SAMN05444002_1510 [Vannielia litorea]